VIGTNKVERIESAAKAAAITLEREDWYALWGWPRAGTTSLKPRRGNSATATPAAPLW
jgi:hypothetical protein